MSSLWVFGYGSLVWRPGFDYTESKIGYISGFSRRFWQGSDVHRGTTEKLGRVVTLTENEKEDTWGRAFRMNDEQVSRAYLDNREASEGGYATRITKFIPLDPKEEPFAVLVYIALPSNPLYLGPTSITKIAKDIAECSGTCGPNVEYLAKLAAFMRLNVPHVWDEHLFTLESLVKMYLLERNSNELLNYFEAAVIEDKDMTLEYWSKANKFENDTEPVSPNVVQTMHFADLVPSRSLRCVKK
ncbi:Cation transport regulator-like protein 1 [Leptotrombidium deliense]|uniref:glutathione-specific gamma-glutamylcyclotransferase n=1 Tax=Leptotrombidium deliense TaxID=299467 RepID=A0A443SPK5_9ACAR|nr:Cation transport regulator-like protein 1 [Leptotrombidium deliense]